MTRPRVARIVSLALLALAAAAGVARKVSLRPTAQEPEDAVYAMIDAARSGDVKAYLGSYTGAIQATLRREAAEAGDAAFTQYLRETNASVKGVAVSDAQKISDDEARVRVEYVYQDRNEAQVLYLEKVRNSWLITRHEAAERTPTSIPYGTPVTALIRTPSQ